MSYRLPDNKHEATSLSHPQIPTTGKPSQCCLSSAVEIYKEQWPPSPLNMRGTGDRDLALVHSGAQPAEDHQFTESRDLCCQTNDPVPGVEDNSHLNWSCVQLGHPVVIAPCHHEDKNVCWGGRGGSEPEFNSQNPQGNSEPSVTSVLEYLMPSSAFLGHCMNVAHREHRSKNTHAHARTRICTHTREFFLKKKACLGSMIMGSFICFDFWCVCMCTRDGFQGLKLSRKVFHH